MRLAYADPPYLGQCGKYGHRHDDGCWNDPQTHARLLVRLSAFDGWALSASSSSLPVVLPLCPPGIRIAAWVKPFCAFKKNVRPAYAWEPVLFYGGRNPPDHPHPPPPKGGKQTTPKDFHSANITLKKGLVGAKPESFCYWIFKLLGAQPGDTLDDLFPGTGVVGRCWERFMTSDCAHEFEIRYSRAHPGKVAECPSCDKKFRDGLEVDTPPEKTSRVWKQYFQGEAKLIDNDKVVKAVATVKALSDEEFVLVSALCARAAAPKVRRGRKRKGLPEAAAEAPKA